MSRIGYSCLILSVLLTSVGCEYLVSASSRKYPDIAAMERQLRQNENLYRRLAEDWLATGGTDMCWFGTSLLGREEYTWGEYWVRSDWWKWNVTHFDGHRNIQVTAASFDRTAILSGTTPDQLLQWHERMKRLGVDCISTITGTFEETDFKYVNFEYFPARYPNGLFYTPPTSNAGDRAFEMWERRAPPPRRMMKAIGKHWFYYDGFYTGSQIPFETHKSSN